MLTAFGDAISFRAAAIKPNWRVCLAITRCWSASIFSWIVRAPESVGESLATGLPRSRRRTNWLRAPKLTNPSSGEGAGRTRRHSHQNDRNTRRKSIGSLRALMSWLAMQRITGAARETAEAVRLSTVMPIRAAMTDLMAGLMRTG